MSNERYHAAPLQYEQHSEKSISKALAEKRITQNDADLIKKFVASLSKGKISPGREFKITSLLVNVRRYYANEYSACDEGDLDVAIKNIRNAVKPDGIPYTRNTKTDFLKTSKRFFLWMSKKGLTKIPREEIDLIVPGRYDMNCKSDADVLTAEEITAIIAAARSSKYKAYIGVLYEAGARSIELANLQWKDVSFHEWGAKVRLTDNKAGTSPTVRTTPIITYASYLATWRQDYPGDASGNNYVFITNRGEPLQYRGVAKALKGFVKDAGITDKSCTLHCFRHTRITHAIRGGMSESLAKRAFWGNPGTNMIQVYEHLTNDDVDREFARQAGIELETEQINDAPEPIQCSTCHFTNPPGARFCARCGITLTPSAIGDLEAAQRFVDLNFPNLPDHEKLEVLALLSKKAVKD